MPLLRVAVVKDQAPEPLALVVPSEVPPLRTVTVLLASALPASTSTVSLVLPKLATVPVMGVTSSVTVVITGAAGAAVSKACVYWAGAVLPLPAASVTALAATSMVTFPELEAEGVTTRV